MTALFTTRQRLIKAIHAAARKHGLDEDSRRAMQLRLTGHESCAEMTGRDLAKVLDELNRGSGASTVRPEVRPDQAKAKALWRSLHDLGAINDYSDRALDAFVRRQAGVSALRFAPAAKVRLLIEALKDMAAHAGVDWSLSEDPRACVIYGQWTRLAAMGALGQCERLDAWLAHRHGVVAVPYLTPAQADDTIRELGRRIRQEAAKEGAGAK